MLSVSVCCSSSLGPRQREALPVMPWPEVLTLWFPCSCICPHEVGHPQRFWDVYTQGPCITFRTMVPAPAPHGNALPEQLQVCASGLPGACSSLGWIIPLLWVPLGSSIGQGRLLVETLDRYGNSGWGIRLGSAGLGQGWGRRGHTAQPHLVTKICLFTLF